MNEPRAYGYKYGNRPTADSQSAAFDWRCSRFCGCSTCPCARSQLHRRLVGAGHGGARRTKLPLFAGQGGRARDPAHRDLRRLGPSPGRPICSGAGANHGPDRRYSDDDSDPPRPSAAGAMRRPPCCWCSPCRCRCSSWWRCRCSWVRSAGTHPWDPAAFAGVALGGPGHSVRKRRRLSARRNSRGDPSERRQGPAERPVALHPASELLWRRLYLVGPVSDRGRPRGGRVVACPVPCC